MSPTLAAIATLTIITLCYIGMCAYAPFGKCRRCSGTGYRRGLLRAFPKPCRACDSTGRRVRLGRRLHTWITTEYRKGQ